MALSKDSRTMKHLIVSLSVYDGKTDSYIILHNGYSANQARHELDNETDNTTVLARSVTGGYLNSGLWLTGGYHNGLLNRQGCIQARVWV